MEEKVEMLEKIVEGLTEEVVDLKAALQAVQDILIIRGMTEYGELVQIERANKDAIIAGILEKELPF